MPATSKFDELCSKLMKCLQASGNLNDLCNVCILGESSEALVSYIWGLDEFHTNLTVDLVPSTKSEVQAEKFRSLGNKFFNEKSYARALELYNMCLMVADHPINCSLTEEENDKDNNAEYSGTNGYKALSNGFADRSSLLFEMKQYKTSRLDIERAIQYGCTKESHPALFQRKFECEIELESFQKSSAETSESSKGNNNSESQLVVTEELKDSHVSNTVDSIHESPKDSATGSVFSMTADDLIFSYTNPDPPKLAETNPNIPSFSASLKVNYTPEQGRFVVADKDIMPGEVILVEKSYVCLPNPEANNLRSRCCICLTRSHVPIPCPTCHTVVFCSEACRDRGIMHQVECSMLPTCIALGLDKNAIQACRVLIRTSFPKLKSQLNFLLDEENNKPRHEHGFNENGKYDSSDYRTIYHLEDNMKNRSASDLFYKSAKAFLLTHMLLETGKFFINECGDALFLPSKSDMILVGTALFNHLMALPQNTYAITEFQVNMNNHRYDAKQQNVAVGVYSAASLFDHSCNSSTTRANYGNVLVLYARQFIPTGSEVSISYGYSYHQDKLDDRKSHLLTDYKFDCKCEACVKNWPMLKDFPDKFKLKPVECKKRKNLEKNMKTYIDKYRQSFREFDIQSKDHKDINTEHLETVMSTTIIFMDKFCELPNRDYFNVQKILTHCIEKKASSYCFRK